MLYTAKGEYLQASFAGLSPRVASSWLDKGPFTLYARIRPSVWRRHYFH